MDVSVSPETSRLLDEAATCSVRRGQRYVGVEHLFEVLVAKSSLLPIAVCEHHLRALQTAAREVERMAWQGIMPPVGPEIFHTPRCAHAINDAAKLAERLSRSQPKAGHLLLAILVDAHAAPSMVMDRLNLGRGRIIETLRNALTVPRHNVRFSSDDATTTSGAKAEPKAAPTSRRGRAAEAELEPLEPLEPITPKSPPGLDSLVRDLTMAARQGSIEPAVGREKEVFEILQILARKTKNNVILVGEAGVGKTKLVEGLAVSAAQGGLPGLPADTRILELDMGALMSGTMYRGAFEEKLHAMLEELKARKDTILFIDEVHLIMGAGAVEGSAIDIANLLKPPLARGELRCIGATTLKEYRKFIEKDPALERRFQMVRIEGLSESATYALLEKLRPSLEKHHGVHIGRRAMRATIVLTQRYMPNRQLPDKAIDILDQACARYRLRAIARKTHPELLFESSDPAVAEKVTPHDIRKVVSQTTGIPIEEITAEDRLLLSKLEQKLKERIIGQDEAVAKVAATVKRSRAGLSDPNRPNAVMLFLGPSGVGKTQLAKELADRLFGSPDHLITFDMSEYVEAHSVSRLLGAPPGYVGSDEEGRLTLAVREKPFSILLFDEIEKAHPRVFDILMPILEEGRLKDSRGRLADFKNCMIILTSNIGADILHRSEDGGERRKVLEELRRHFRPEFINRIDEIVPFYPLLFEDVRSILRLFVNELRMKLRERKIGVRMYQGAYEFLASQGYSPEFGARELRRVVERHVTNPISEMLLSGKFISGDIIAVLMEDGQLTFRREAQGEEGVGNP